MRTFFVRLGQFLLGLSAALLLTLTVLFWVALHALAYYLNLRWVASPETPGYDSLISLLTMTADIVVFPIGLLWTVLRYWYVERKKQGQKEEAETSTTTSQHKINRLRMLEKMERIWIGSVLSELLRTPLLLKLELKIEIKTSNSALDIGSVIPSSQTNRSFTTLEPIINTFDEISGTILIQGESGSGKTTVLLQLLQSLLERAMRNDDHPIPVVFSLSSWSEKYTSMEDWLVDELHRQYLVPFKVAKFWVNNDVMIPLLDNLDGVSKEKLEKCIGTINEFHNQHGLLPLVICCRTENYSATSAKIELDGIVSVQPLALADIDIALSQIGDEMRGFHAAIREDASLQEMIENPLNLYLIATTFKHIDINDLTSFDAIDKRKERLFAAYIDYMFQKNRSRLKYDRGETVSWLKWIAIKMNDLNYDVFKIEKIQMNWLPTKFQEGVANLVVATLLGSIFALILTIPLYFPNTYTRQENFFLHYLPFLAWQIAAFQILLRKEIKTVEVLVWSWSRAWQALIAQAVIIVPLVFITWLLMGWFGVTLALIRAVLLLFFQLNNILGSEEVKSKSYPNEGIWNSGRSCIIATLIGLPVGLLFGAVVLLQGISKQNGLIFELLNRLLPSIESNTLVTTTSYDNYYVIGVLLLFALIGGAVFGLLKGGLAFARHFLLRIALFFNNKMPLNYVSFLDYASDLVFLRKIGDGYIFFHRSFQDYLASSNTVAGRFKHRSSKN